MSELSKSPIDIFTSDAPGIIFEEVNGITVPILQMSDISGNYLAFPAMDKSLSDICGSFILVT